MLYLFATHPLWYIVPALATLAIWILLARFLPQWQGEGNAIVREPGIIVCGSFFWFLTVPFAIIGGVIWLLEKAVRVAVGPKAR